MSERFQAKKKSILERLSLPDEEYTDCSPKGSIDEPIRSLVNEINVTSDFVTTSSCSGRIAVYVEGSPNTKPGISPESNATSTGGKGGGRWLFTSHSPIQPSGASNPGALLALLGFSNSQISFPNQGERIRHIHFKFEPMVSLSIKRPSHLCTKPPSDPSHPHLNPSARSTRSKRRSLRRLPRKRYQQSFLWQTQPSEPHVSRPKLGSIHRFDHWIPV